KPLYHLSTGQLRRLFLARALVCQPRVLLLDEPLSGLDAGSRAFYLALLDRLVLGHEAIPAPTLIFVSHVFDERPRCLTRFAKMENGCLSILS
ncbi:MAG: ATP-binding cassette domain-containing protein, partial [Desulfovibrio sp.]|nr:ATP-binding cassette domain-containing protein [Desulfovibrio sp.]